MGTVSEFREFLEEYKVVGLAIAFVIGIAAKDLVSSIVENLIMPVVEVILPGGEWQETVVSAGPITFGAGPLLAQLINFTIIAFLVFFVSKKIIKEKKPAKK